MTHQVSLSGVFLVTLCLEGLLYGAMMVLFALSTYLLLVRGALLRPQQFDSKGAMARLFWALMNPFVFLSILVTLGATGHWFVSCVRAFMAFVSFQGVKTEAFLENLAHPTQIASSSFTIAVTILSDSMCIHRTWVVWGRSKAVVIFPVITLIGFLVSGAGALISVRSKVFEGLIAEEYSHWITALSYLSLSTNIYCTVTIVWRILTLDNEVRRLRSAYSTSVLGVVVESAVIYTIWVIFFTATFQAGSTLQFLAIYCSTPMAGLAFMMINVRIGLGWAHRSMSFSSTSPSVQSLYGNAVIKHPGMISGDEYALRPLAIKVEREVNRTNHCTIDFSERKGIASSNTVESVLEMN